MSDATAPCARVSDAAAACHPLNSFCTRPSPSVYVIGLMSGTSLDGVDAVVAHFPSPDDSHASAQARTAAQSARIMAHHFVSMPVDLRAQLLALNSPSGDLSAGGELHQSALASNALSHLYARAVRELLAKAKLRPDQIMAIGNHGQTVRHVPGAPSHYTLQLGNHALLAELTSIPVIADFRSRDVAAGGTGAPLVPAFHQALLSSIVAPSDSSASTGAAGDAPAGDVLVLNLGGIANVSWVRRDGSVLGFDTGPANVLADLWIQAQRIPAPVAPAAADSDSSGNDDAPSSTLQYDAGGAWGATGRVIPELLESLLCEPYFALSPPKSTGRDLFSPAWLAAHHLDTFVAQGHAPADVMATLVELTAVSVAQAIERFCRDDRDGTTPAAATVAAAGSPTPVYVCGGGAFNSLLLSRLAALMPGRRVATTEQACGVGVDCMEALAFAWLAWRFLHGQTANMPAVTGAKGTRILGAYYPA